MLAVFPIRAPPSPVLSQFDLAEKSRRRYLAAPTFEHFHVSCQLTKGKLQVSLSQDGAVA